MKDKTEGKWDQVKGKVKEETGKVVGDRSTEWGGKAEQVQGKVKEGIGEVKQAKYSSERERELAEERDRTDTPR
jgi:uncharacterized protein YjbJ (UPF0337 family)